MKKFKDSESFTTNKYQNIILFDDTIAVAAHKV
jgi:hypothetical protein